MNTYRYSITVPSMLARMELDRTHNAARAQSSAGVWLQIVLHSGTAAEVAHHTAELEAAKAAFIEAEQGYMLAIILPAVAAIAPVLPAAPDMLMVLSLPSTQQADEQAEALERQQERRDSRIANLKAEAREQLESALDALDRDDDMAPSEAQADTEIALRAITRWAALERDARNVSRR